MTWTASSAGDITRTGSAHMAWPERLAARAEWLSDLADKAGVSWFDYQWDVFLAEADTDPEKLRACLYYKTGAGKTFTSLVLAQQAGHTHVLVVTPPATYDAWLSAATALGMTAACISHAKFRMKDFKLSRTGALIVDEFHMLGGHNGKGFAKLDRAAQFIKAPVIINSATPNYNDAERVYCVQHVLDPLSCRGGYLQFLVKNCITEADRFSMTPKVLGFLNFKEAKDYLAALPHVYYVPDNVAYKIVDIPVTVSTPPEFETHGFDRRRRRMLASLMEKKHQRIFQSLVDEDGLLAMHVFDVLTGLMDRAKTPVLIYADHSTVADALERRLAEYARKSATITGSTPAKKKKARLDAFRDGVLDVLVGTATLGTGVDGLDKMCDTLIILDDTTDDAARRQLIGRIMPRGESVDASKKQVYRLVLQ